MKKSNRLLEKYITSTTPKPGFELVGVCNGVRLYRKVTETVIEDSYYDHMP